MNMENKYVTMHETIKTMFKEGYCSLCGSKNVETNFQVCVDCQKLSTADEADPARYLAEIARLKKLLSLCEYMEVR